MNKDFSQLQPSSQLCTIRDSIIFTGCAAICFTAAGSDKVELKDQEVQTEIAEKEHDPESLAKQQGENRTAYLTLKWIGYNAVIAPHIHIEIMK